MGRQVSDQRPSARPLRKKEPPVKIYIVRAAEQDYYPDEQVIGAFTTREAADAFLAAQPSSVFRYPSWRDSDGRRVDPLHQNDYTYSVEELELDPPIAPWASDVPWEVPDAP